MFAAIDLTLTRWMQAGYDYVRDRWDIYIATYRSALGCLVMLYGIVIPILISPVSGTTKAIALTVHLAIFYYLMLRQHVELEWDMQHDNREKLLNKLALREQEYGTARILVLAAVSAINLCFFSPTWTLFTCHVIATGFAAGYLWSRCVLIRDRDSTRFAQGHMANSFG